MKSILIRTVSFFLAACLAADPAAAAAMSNELLAVPGAPSVSVPYGSLCIARRFFDDQALPARDFAAFLKPMDLLGVRFAQAAERAGSTPSSPSTHPSIPSTPEAYYLRALGIEIENLPLKNLKTKGPDHYAIHIAQRNIPAYEAAFRAGRVKPGDLCELLFENGKPIGLLSGVLPPSPSLPQGGRVAIYLGAAIDPTFWPKAGLPVPDTWTGAYIAVEVPALRATLAEFFPVYGIATAGRGHSKATDVLLLDLPLVEGQEILEPFTGTGIVGLACALRGAKRVVMYDSNPFAVWNARFNAMILGVNDRVQIYQAADVAELPSDIGEFDRVLAVAPVPADPRDLTTKVMVPTELTIRDSDLPRLLRQNTSDPGGKAFQTLLLKVRRHLKKQADVRIHVGYPESLRRQMADLAERGGLYIEEVHIPVLANADGYVQYIFAPISAERSGQAGPRVPADLANLAISITAGLVHVSDISLRECARMLLANGPVLQYVQDIFRRQGGEEVAAHLPQILLGILALEGAVPEEGRIIVGTMAVLVLAAAKEFGTAPTSKDSLPTPRVGLKAEAKLRSAA